MEEGASAPVAPGYAPGMRAWYAYWATVAIAVLLWLGALVVGGRDVLPSMLASPIGLVVLLIPIAAAGLNLVLYRQTHEEVCRLETERHRSMRLIAGNGYSANTFALTGLALIALAIVILVLQLSG